MQLASVESSFRQGGNAFPTHITVQALRKPSLVTLSSAAATPSDSSRRNVIIGVAASAALVLSKGFMVEPALAVRTSPKPYASPEAREKLKEEIEEIKKKSGKVATLAGNVSFSG